MVPPSKCRGTEAADPHLLDVQRAAQLAADAEGGPLQWLVDQQHVVLPGLRAVGWEAARGYKGWRRYHLQKAPDLFRSLYECIGLVHTRILERRD